MAIRYISKVTVSPPPRQYGQRRKRFFFVHKLPKSSRSTDWHIAEENHNPAPNPEIHLAQYL